jgi:hypothetical protein
LFPDAQPAAGIFFKGQAVPALIFLGFVPGILDYNPVN